MSKEYNISKTAGRCVKCNAALTPGMEIVATVREIDDGFQREDYCVACWPGENDHSADLLGVWRCELPQASEKKRLFVDNDILVNFFQRLDGANESAKVNFRFVLALILMRKKLLVYDGREVLSDGQEMWKMHFKGNPAEHKVFDPKMDEVKIAEVSQSLGEILEGEL
ncbi:MAG: hypothetical protein EHM48_01480 [Planctomycetaceae bacterium]|nr:MAG: hypothetical protein EHM48_01480 [Planctomycetaceae bacterium]